MPNRSGPARIVCLTEEPAEILYALGASDRIVGISAYTVRPARARAEKPVVSAFMSGSVPKIAALSPDLVIGFSDVQGDLARDLIRAHLPVLILNQRSIDEILGVVQTLGQLVDQKAAATRLCDNYQQSLDAMRARTKALRRPRVYFEEWHEPMICGSEWVSELIEVAGGEDIFRERARHKSAKARVVTEAMVREAAPDIILVSWCGKPYEPAHIKACAGLVACPALQRDQVFEIPSALILQPGPAALTDGVAAIDAIFQAWRTQAS